MMMYRSFRDNVVCIIHEIFLDTEMKTSLLSKDQNMLQSSPEIRFVSGWICRYKWALSLEANDE